MSSRDRAARRTRTLWALRELRPPAPSARGPGPSVRLCARPRCSRGPPGRGGRTPAPSGHSGLDTVSETRWQNREPGAGAALVSAATTPRFRARGPRRLRESETRRRGEVPFSPSLCRNPLCQTGPERGAARCGDAAAQTLAPALPCDDVTACVVGKHVSRGSSFQGHLLPGPVCIVLNIRLRIRTKRTSTCLES